MKVQDVMTSNVKSCRPETSLAEAAKMMWENDCGILPVVSAEKKIMSTITDRDVAIAVGTRNQPAWDITVREVMPEIVVTAAPSDDIKSTLRTMGTARERRLPVTDGNGVLRGILSMNDVVLQTATGPRDPSCEDIINTLKEICEHQMTRAAMT
jgi:CBS domain-containing protein